MSLNKDEIAKELSELLDSYKALHDPLVVRLARIITGMRIVFSQLRADGTNSRQVEGLVAGTIELCEIIGELNGDPSNFSKRITELCEQFEINIREFAEKIHEQQFKAPDFKPGERWMTVQRLGSGWAAVVMWMNNKDIPGEVFPEPWDTGLLRYDTEAEATIAAQIWARDQEITFYWRTK
jgi:hypothetical protein